MSERQILDRFRGALVGLATGDAVGTTVEFSPRGTFEPVTDMVGGGPFRLEPGEWTDDTSMALCLATSLVECNGFDAGDQMRRYTNWYRNGYLSSNGECFDIGNTVTGALHRFEHTGDPFSGSTEPNSAGNGCLMRLAPVPMHYFPDGRATAHFARQSSRTTHGAALCVDACDLFATAVHRALLGQDKETILFHEFDAIAPESPLAGVASGDYRDKSRDDIRGTGFVLHSLEAALWCFWRHDSFEAAILEAANLGDDADTTAAICGQIAGAYYGESSIPEPWLDRLVMRDDIRDLADRLHHTGSVAGR